MTDRLAFWGSNVDLAINRIDYTSVPRRSSGDVNVRVKNLSTEYDATNPVVSVEGTGADQYYLSLDDGLTFTATVALDDLSASAISRVITVRRATPSTAPTGAMTCTLRAHAGGWTPAHLL